MIWDPDRYEEWFETPEGAFALDRESRLLQEVIAGWPRRGKKLLELGCGTGLFLEILWQLGFDVTGLDKSPEMVMAGRKRFGNRAELHLGDASDTPFEENEFDYVFLWSVLEFSSQPEAILAEAARVAEKGIIVGFLNRASLYYRKTIRKTSGTMSKAHWYNWYEVQDMIKNATGFSPVTARSTLLGPASTWGRGGLWSWANDALLPPQLGAFTACRVDFVNIKPLTPLFAWRTEPGLS